jgi:hypothetical protein
MHGDNLNADFSQFPTEISLAEGFHEASPIPDTNAPAPHSSSKQKKNYGKSLEILTCTDRALSIEASNHLIGSRGEQALCLQRFSEGAEQR